MLPMLCCLSFLFQSLYFSEPSVQGMFCQFFPTHTILYAPWACAVIGSVLPQALRVFLFSAEDGGEMEAAMWKSNILPSVMLLALGMH